MIAVSGLEGGLVWRGVAAPPYFFYFGGGACLGLVSGFVCCLAGFSGLFLCCFATELLLRWFPGVIRVPFVERRVGKVWMGSPILFSSLHRNSTCELSWDLLTKLMVTFRFEDTRPGIAYQEKKMDPANIHSYVYMEAQEQHTIT